MLVLSYKGPAKRLHQWWYRLKSKVFPSWSFLERMLTPGIYLWWLSNDIPLFLFIKIKCERQHFSLLNKRNRACCVSLPSGFKCSLQKRRKGKEKFMRLGKQGNFLTSFIKGPNNCWGWRIGPAEMQKRDSQTVELPVGCAERPGVAASWVFTHIGVGVGDTAVFASFLML